MPTIFRPEDQNLNPSQAPTIGGQSGTFGANDQQRRNINQQGGSGRFTNLQQYVQANEQNNPNAQLLQREASARQGELGTKQQQFVTQATPIKTGLETIRTGQQFVQSALANPTQYTTPERLQQFAGYRTGGVGDVETPYNQLQTLRSGLGTQQEQLASGLETIKSNPTALQNYIQSQRANPALATRGENVLDRFLTQSTQSGQQAIAGLGTAASAIRASQAPSIVGDIEALRTQAQGQPLSSADVRNLLTGQITPQEQYIKDINNLYLARNVGLGANLGEDKIQYSNNVLQTPIMSYERPTNLGTVDQSNIDQAKAQFDKYTNLNNQLIESDRKINIMNDNIEKLSNKPAGIDPFDPFNEDLKKYKARLEEYKKEKDQIARKLSGMDVSKVPTYQEYQNRLGNTKEQLLSEYDPTRLSKIQALQQLAGTNVFSPLLQQRLA
jgi:hypothetical protein